METCGTIDTGGERQLAPPTPSQSTQMDLTPRLHHQSLTSFDSPDAAPVLDGSVTDYVVLSKAATGGYDEFVRVRTATEAWTARKKLAATHTDRKFFVRAQRVYITGPTSAEAREDRDLWQDAWKTGNDHLVPAEQRTEYLKWAAQKTTNKYARFQTDRDAPRWDGGHRPSLGGEFQTKSWGK